MNPIFIGKKHSHKSLLYFRIIADSEAENENDISKIGNKTTNIYKQNPVPNGYYKISELQDILKSGYYGSPFGLKNVNCYVNEVIKLENEMVFYFRNTKKDIIMTKEDEEDYGKTIFVNFVNEKFYLIKFVIIFT